MAASSQGASLRGVPGPRQPSLERIPRREQVRRLPRPVAGEPGLVSVDATWGTIQPLRLSNGVETVAELEVIERLRAGGLLVDCRQPPDVARGRIPGALAIRHQGIVAGLEPHRDRAPVVLYCNGPQCLATPDAVSLLLDAGWAPARLRYYRGGIHDWVTLGLPLAAEPQA